MPTRVTVRRDKTTALLVIAGANKNNTLDMETLLNLHRKLTDLVVESAENHLSCLIMIGSGNYAFSTGSNIAELAELIPETALKYSQLGQSVMALIANLSCPVICCLNGVAYGAGLELALAADFRIAADGANFAFPAAKLGLLPCFGGTQRCPNLIGLSRSKELLYLGNVLAAPEALEWGLIDEIVPYTELLATAQERAQELNVKPFFALQQIKKALASRGEDFALEQKLFANCYRQKGIKQRILAWLGQHQDELEGFRSDRKIAIEE